MYEQDFYAWANTNAQLLRAGKLPQIDTQNIAEELEAMGRSEKRELTHLLKWECQPERRSESWKNTIETQSEDVLELLEESPSLRREVEDKFENAYLKATRTAAAETGLSKEGFPKVSPFSLKQALGETFWPD